MFSEPRRRFVINSLKTLVLFAFNKPLLSVAKDRRKYVYPSWKELVEIARWCPTVHNLQPHKLKVISDTEAELYYDPSRLLPVGDPKCIFVTVAMGVFIEHLNIAAKSNDIKVEISKVYEPINAQANKLTLFALLEMVPNSLREPLNRNLILKRRTSRLHYDDQLLSNACIEKVSKEVAAFQHQFFYTHDKSLVHDIIKLNQQTLFEDLESKPDRNELDHLFRYSKDEASVKKDGLWAKCMCFPGALMKSVFHHYNTWDKGIAKSILSNFYKNSFKGTSTVCWIGGKFDNTEDWLLSGKLLARMWLTVTSENAYIHPFGSLVTNVSAYKIINEKFTAPSQGKKIWMIFRAGYSSEPARSFRLDTDQIIIK